MNGKTARILSYITWIGWIIALVSGDKDNDEGLKQHLNQALICNILDSNLIKSFFLNKF